MIFYLFSYLLTNYCPLSYEIERLTIITVPNHLYQLSTKLAIS